MEQLITATEKSLQLENWYSALFISLSLPDICGKIENPTLSSKERYIIWFNKYLSHKYIHEVGVFHVKHIFLTGEDMYAFRCALLHEGVDDISCQNAKNILNKFVFGISGSHCNFFTHNNIKTLQLDVKIFCNEICEAVRHWIVENQDNDEMKNRINNLIKVYTGVIQIGNNYIG